MRTVKEILVALGLAALARPLLGGVGSILVMHRLSGPDPGLSFAANRRNAIAPEHFELLLDTLAADAMVQERLLRNNPRPIAQADARRLYEAAL